MRWRTIGKGVGFTVGAVLIVDEATKDVVSWRERIVRCTRTAAVAVAISLDYKLTLRNVEYHSNRYNELKKEIHLRSAERILDLCNRNGGIYVKGAQHVASLDYALPPEYTKTLAVMQDQAPSVSYETVQDLMMHEFGKSPLHLFEVFDKTPIASGSLAQVHRAVTREGYEVAVKVQYPRVSALLETDIWAIKMVAQLTAWVWKERQYEWIVPLFRENLLSELDFTAEGKRSERAAYNFRKKTRVYIPNVHWNYTTKRILTMEFVRGVKVTDKEGIRAIGLNPRDVAYRVSKTFGAMIYSHGFVHCDPHPGNILVSNHPNDGGVQITLLDHGLYKSLPQHLRLNYCKLWKAMILQDQKLLQEAADALGAGKWWNVFPLILTYRRFNSRSAIGERMSQKDRESLKAEFSTVKEEDVAEFLEGLPRDVLLILRTNNLVRHINFQLGGTTSDRLHILFNSAISGLHGSDEGRTWKQSCQLIVDRAKTKLVLSVISAVRWMFWSEKESETEAQKDKKPKIMG